ncbi:DUF5686 and carboxypeptidase regulatory-like domain-containing protein [Sphingobacterium deserti]|nr:DUF5686 and carboxypeptidase regulatory-like domain-containing protein [Sphingobacterium deserti]
MKFIATLLSLLSPIWLFAQVNGTVSNKNGERLPSVTVLLKNSYMGTSTNANGEFSFERLPKGRQTLIFKSLGYQTYYTEVDICEKKIQIDILLEEEMSSLEEVVVTNRENPAIRIIKQAIRHRDENGSKIDSYRADFYSKGLMRVENLPKKMARAGAEDIPGLDSTGSGIIYLSETVSKISFKKPNKLYEEVIASKVSGDDKGFSFNTAIGANIDFYSNTVGLWNGVISPIAYNALSYYNYTLINSREEDGQTVFKIKVAPKRDKEPTVDGLIYIVEDSWEIYAVDFSLPGYRLQQPVLDTLQITQHYAWNHKDQRRTKSFQRLDFKISFFGIKASGNYMQNFSNYEFVKVFPKGTFGNTLTKINKGSNLLDSAYWNFARPVELTKDERRDYALKDSAQAVRKSKAYLDSVDRSKNKFNPLDPIMGYSYQNSENQIKIEYLGLNNVTKASFNAVQGFTWTASINASVGAADTGSFSNLRNDFQYGFSDKKLRFNATYEHRFNTKNYATLALNFGNRATPFNDDQGPLPLINNITSLFFKDSYLQFYQREQVRLRYTQHMGVPFHIMLSAAWANRSPLFNNSNYSFFRKERNYVSNNPLAPTNYIEPAFFANRVLEAEVGLRWAVGQKAVDRPDATLLLRDMRYPLITVRYKQALNLTSSGMSYQLLQGSIAQSRQFGHFGMLSARINAGAFFNAENIPFTDYKHFSGNQTHIGTTSIYDNTFLLLPYYSHSTNKGYVEFHAEQDFKGYLFNKIPVVQELQWGLIAGYHFLHTPDRRPYQEVSVGIDNIGWGKYRLLRVDYVHAIQDKASIPGVVVGLKFLNILN